MRRSDLAGVLAVLALSLATPAGAQTRDRLPNAEPQDSAELRMTQELNRRVEAEHARAERADREEEAAYEAEMAAYAMAVAAASIPDLHERLDLINTSSVDVTCNVHRGGVATGTVLRIPSGGSIRLDGPDEDNPQAIPIAEIQLRCPRIAANALHGNFRSARRYVIQRGAGNRLVLVEVTTAPADRE